MSFQQCWRGYTHIGLPFDFLYEIWKRACCPRGWHLWDECLSGIHESHHIVCDACQVSEELTCPELRSRDE